MITVRRAEERGRTVLDWLDSRHTFSFDQYFDPSHMSFRALRVINEDRVAPGAGFPMHRHRDMEILTYVLEGALEHKDSLGNGSVIRPGEVQRMSAGTGVMHSEFNASKNEPVHFLQIWILPERQHLAAGYEQKQFSRDALSGNWLLLAAPESASGSGSSALTVHQDVQLYAARLAAGETLNYSQRRGRHAWLQVAAGELELGGHALHAGDGAAISGQESFTLRAASDAEALLFDLA
jgi:redox-sensitive bicupin YhaK (pirin superfamily)